ncbi:hypothetical protein [Streptomyces palmae]|uniref:DUF8094 domain-containing protein n=1 Tax=Streptomyces palmae TaxID=1701085 RepID=A0A4Z0GGM0_9ACTN|nr:hypothetical protein [Streptomyces palmae]TGA95687.1 hypothetical protein E4099_24850 [Streptomyces palmae]
MSTPLVAAALLLAPALTGCTTVHGERENIPSVDRAEASQALRDFTDTYNTAYRKLDPDLVARVETGPLHAINSADLTAQHAGSPRGNPGFPALELTDARYLIPRQVGWPKFFVADTRSNREQADSGTRWLLLFTRDEPRTPWRVAYLSILSRDEVPRFATDRDGYAQPVPPGTASRLALRPDRLSKAYTDYLMTGEGTVFAAGGSTSALRESRKKTLRTPKYWTEYIDTPAAGPRYAPAGLRLADGGALVFFTSHHSQKQTMAKGMKPNPDDRVKALMTGEARKSITLTRVSEAAVRVPAKDAADQRVVFLNRVEGVTAAKGE